MTTRKKKLQINDDVSTGYMNWLAQMCSIMMPTNFALISGRASAKTTQFLAERLQEAVYDCPGAPFVWVSDTYSNLHKNVIKSLMEGLRFLGWEEGTHFVMDKQPPEEWRNQMYNVLPSFKQTMVFWTGFNLTFVSLDRPSIGAGSSYVGLFGDEVKYFPQQRIANLLKAIRGYRVKYGNSPWYRSISFTTDMPNPNNIGEEDWIFNYAKQNDKEKIFTLLETGFVYNDTKIEYLAAVQNRDEIKEEHGKGAKLDKAEKEVQLAKRNMDRWEELWISMRKRSSFFWIASSFVNVDVLSEEWFQDEFATGLQGIEQSILSLSPKLEAGNRFYANLSERHFYDNGCDYDYLDTVPYGEEPDCRLLKFLNKSMPIEGGMDAGNMLSLTISQMKGNTKRILKELFTLPPNHTRELADEFIRYFKPQVRKILKLRHDRSMNQYSKVSADMAKQIKDCIETDADGNRTGWTVELLSQGQGDISSNLEYRMFMDILAETNPKLPVIRIDRTNCPNLKSQMEKTPTKISTGSKTKGQIVKEKKGDKLPLHRLAKESTNLTDALKYDVCSKDIIRLWQSGRTTTQLYDPH